MTKSVPPAKINVNLLILDQVPIFDQLQIEEALLRADNGNWCILNCGVSPAIVMGISGIREKLIDIERLSECPIPVIRRFSGGGTVFVDKDTVFATWICNADDVKVACYPQQVHAWTVEFYQKTFPMLNMHLRENDYVIGERKWGGNAQYLSKGRWLHHTSMLWDYNSNNMNYLLLPTKRPEYRLNRSHGDFLCCLRDHFPERYQVKRQIVQQMQREFVVREVSLSEIGEILERPHRKATVFLD